MEKLGNVIMRLLKKDNEGNHRKMEANIRNTKLKKTKSSAKKRICEKELKNDENKICRTNKKQIDHSERPQIGTCASKLKEKSPKKFVNRHSTGP